MIVNLLPCLAHSELQSSINNTLNQECRQWKSDILSENFFCTKSIYSILNRFGKSGCLIWTVRFIHFGPSMLWTVQIQLTWKFITTFISFRPSTLVFWTAHFESKSPPLSGLLTYHYYFDPLIISHIHKKLFEIDQNWQKKWDHEPIKVFGRWSVVYLV